MPDTHMIVKLNESNYPTWKLQCKMSLMIDGVWRIVDGTEVSPTEGADEATDRITNTTARNAYFQRRDRALATIVLSIAVISYSKPRGSSGCMEDTIGTVPKENMGE